MFIWFEHIYLIFSLEVYNRTRACDSEHKQNVNAVLES